MPASLVRWATSSLALLLILFNLRRFIFTLAALGRRRRPVLHSSFSLHPSVLILAPCRNESAALPGLIETLARVDYPCDRLRVALIDDGSSDDTRAIMQRAVNTFSGWSAVALDGNLGKAQALNEALARIAFGEIVVVYDADHRPEPGSLRRLASALDDPLVAGASGRTKPIHPTASLAAYYSAVENLVHQTITLRAKDRFDLAPALLGSNCAYRRSLLEQAGGFPSGVLLEDSDLTLTFARLGYRLRFVPDAVAWQQMPQTVESYVRQHVRWARGFNDVARKHALGTLADRRLPLRLRIELAMFSAGYLDRLALLGAIGVGWITGSRRRVGFLGPIMATSLVMPLVEVVAAMLMEPAPRSMWVRLPAMPVLFGLDVLIAARALLESVLGRPRAWAETVRMGESASRRV